MDLYHRSTEILFMPLIGQLVYEQHCYSHFIDYNIKEERNQSLAQDLNELVKKKVIRIWIQIC